MEDVLRMIFSAENVRMAVLLVAAACGFTWLKSKMDKRIDSLREEMNGKFAAQDDIIRSLRGEMNEKFAVQSSEIRELKTNDIAHLYAAIEALVFSMVKNKTLTETDQQYINDRLHSTH
ncbi:MAG: hypothetical protein MdMp014T_2717 [Treponematales bacterium]|jgi:Arc/MetJ-type ribon-helix-helix transcriptional regulator